MGGRGASSGTYSLYGKLLKLCCDVMNGWAFSNMNLADDTNNPNSAWKIVTPGFATLSDALSFPVLEGKSIRERFPECRFFVE